AANGSAGAHAADKVCNLALGVFPDFGAGGLVVRFGIGGIVVLIGVIRIGDFTGQLFRDAVIAARIFGLNSGGANDHFGAQGLEQVNFFLGLFVRRCENTFVTAHGGHQSQPHAGVAACAFDDGATGLQKAF